jgi:hypothetical protein
VYQDDSGYRPLQASNVEAVARNIRNIRSPDRVYPSSVHVEGTLFDAGSVVLEGNADFLAKPQPGFKTGLRVDRVDLSYFEPLTRRLGLEVRGGLLAADGQVEYGRGVQIVDLDSVVVSAADVDYVLGGAVDEEALEVARQVKETTKEIVQDPETLLRVRQLVMQDGTIGFVNLSASPQYRVYVAGAQFELANLSSRVEDGAAHATLRGTFMGSGRVAGTAAFEPAREHPDFQVKLEVVDSDMTRMNDLLRAHAKLDVVAGVFSVFTEVQVRDGRIEGYVKPLFRDLDVYDPEQDRKKNVFRKMYEGIAGGLAKMLENDKRDEVATRTRISGPVNDPRSDTWQIVGNLLRNAMAEAILPGFERELAEVNPLLHRRRERDSRREEKRRRTSDNDQAETKERSWSTRS